MCTVLLPPDVNPIAVKYIIHTHTQTHTHHTHTQTHTHIHTNTHTHIHTHIYIYIYIYTFVPILSQTNPPHKLPKYFFMIHFDIMSIFPSTSKAFKLLAWRRWH